MDVPTDIWSQYGIWSLPVFIGFVLFREWIQDRKIARKAKEVELLQQEKKALTRVVKIAHEALPERILKEDEIWSDVPTGVVRIRTGALKAREVLSNSIPPKDASATDDGQKE